MKKLLKISFVTLTLLNIGCEPFPNESQEMVTGVTTSTEENPTQGEELILGKQLENPYSLANMRKAKGELKQNVAKLNFTKKNLEKPLEATHRYVVFLPENEMHNKILENLVSEEKYTLREHPMDYEVLQYGAVYKDSRTKNEEYPVLYASLPVDLELPDVPFEHLEWLYLPDENEEDDLLTEASLFLTGNISDEEIITRVQRTRRSTQPIDVSQVSLVDFIGDVQLFWNPFKKKYYPEGTVRAFDTNRQAYVPVPNVSIEIYNWFFSSHYTTDANGNFRARDRYSREMGVYFTWRNHSATIRTHWNELAGIMRVSDKIGNINRGWHTYNIERHDSHKWKKVTVHNAIEKFNNYLSRAGIAQRVTGANVWVWRGNSQMGAAPMLKTYSGTVGFKMFVSGWLKWISPLTLPLAEHSKLVPHLHPDMVFIISEEETQAMERLVFHESAHFIHAKQVGRDYWGTFVGKTVDNIINKRGPYGDGTQPSQWSGQHIALAEGWANFLSNKIMFELYPAEDWLYSLEDIQTHTTPSVIEGRQININRIRREKIEITWFLHGLIWDLTDRENDSVILRNGQTGNLIIQNNNTDRVFIGGSGKHEVRALFEMLGNGEKTGFDLKNRLLRTYTGQRTEIEQLFNAYGY